VFIISKVYKTVDCVIGNENKITNSVHILVVAIVAGLVSTAFVISLSTVPSAAQQLKAADEFNGKKTNDYYQTVSTQPHNNVNSHIASLVPNNDNLNQTKVTELRISLHDLWIEHIIWTRHM
jgi:hypothetical protein